MIHGRLSLMLGARPILDSVTPSCEGRPPAFQASRATRATNRAVASAACLEGPRGARYPICGCSGRPAFPTPSLGERFLQQLGRIAPRGAKTHVWIGPPSLRGAQRRSNPYFLCCAMDCFAPLAMTTSMSTASMSKRLADKLGAFQPVSPRQFGRLGDAGPDPGGD